MIGSLYTGHTVVFRFMFIEERSMITVYTELYCTCEYSYMFRQYKCSLHEVGYGNL